MNIFFMTIIAGIVATVVGQQINKYFDTDKPKRDVNKFVKFIAQLTQVIIQCFLIAVVIVTGIIWVFNPTDVGYTILFGFYLSGLSTLLYFVQRSSQKKIVRLFGFIIDVHNDLNWSRRTTKYNFANIANIHRNLLKDASNREEIMQDLESTHDYLMSEAPNLKRDELLEFGAVVIVKETEEADSVE